MKWGATFVARSFSGDKKQLQAILKTAIAHRGLSVIDVISPCVTFNDHEGSTKSYSYMKEHEELLQELDFVPFFEDISVDIPEGEMTRCGDARWLAPADPQTGSRLRPDQTGLKRAGGPGGSGSEQAKCSPAYCMLTPSKPTFRRIC